MTPAASERARVRLPVLLFSALAWVLLITAPGTMAMHAHHGGRTPGMDPISLKMMFVHNSPASLAAGWAIMVVAMMGPMLTEPIRHIWVRSFARRRAPAITLYLAGYGMVWMVVGALLLTLAFMLASIVGSSSWPLAVALAAAAVWQFSPLKQMCLNRGHVHAALAAFGWPATRDALKFGVVHGFWCVGTCSMLMLAALLFAKGHLLAMGAATAFLVTERFERPATPQWSWRLPSKAIRIALAHLSPGYDFVATLPYIPGDTLALSFGGSRSLSAITPDQMRRFADTAGIPASPLWRIAVETAERTVAAWKTLEQRNVVPKELGDSIGKQILGVAAAIK